MSSPKSGSPDVDQARGLLCRVFAEMIEAGSLAVRTRLLLSSGAPVQVCFYSHGSGGWQKHREVVNNVSLVGAIKEVIEMLASKRHGDQWSVRQHSSSDCRDTDIHFHDGELKTRGDMSSEWSLMGLLFRDAHDSNKDSRRTNRIR